MGFRYDGRHKEEFLEDAGGYEYRDPPASVRLEPVTVLKAVACYEYQACEHPGWRESEAHAIMRALEALTIARLPGWEAAPWGMDFERTVPGHGRPGGE